jgi:glycosylphosphatidylinositol transamidase (GPIT) subunit GPI8
MAGLFYILTFSILFHISGAAGELQKLAMQLATSRLFLHYAAMHNQSFHFSWMRQP